MQDTVTVQESLWVFIPARSQEGCEYYLTAARDVVCLGDWRPLLLLTPAPYDPCRVSCSALQGPQQCLTGADLQEQLLLLVLQAQAAEAS